MSVGLERSYELLFEMTKLEVEGFRRMRTISQLTFETLIQMILQLRMLLFFWGERDKLAGKNNNIRNVDDFKG